MSFSMWHMLIAASTVTAIFCAGPFEAGSGALIVLGDIEFDPLQNRQQEWGKSHPKGKKSFANWRKRAEGKLAPMLANPAQTRLHAVADATHIARRARS